MQMALALAMILEFKSAALLSQGTLISFAQWDHVALAIAQALAAALTKNV